MELKKFILAFAKHAAGVFTEMTSIKVSKLGIQEAESVLDFQLAMLIEYTLRDEPEAKGLFVLGLSSERVALAIAAAVMKKMGVAAPSSLDDDAIDALGELLNTVIGLTISDWDKDGLSATFGTPALVKLSHMHKMNESRQENYKIILNLAAGRMEFGIAFNHKITQKIKGGKRVLVVDDSKVMRKVITDILEGAGYVVQSADDGKLGVEAYKQFTPVVTVMDLVMPNMGGLEAMNAIRALDPESRFIVLSSSGRNDEIESAKAIGVVDYLTKPMTPPALLKAVEKACAAATPPSPPEHHELAPHASKPA